MVGGRTPLLGEMYQNSTSKHQYPNGFCHQRPMPTALPEVRGHWKMKSKNPQDLDTTTSAT